MSRKCLSCKYRAEQVVGGQKEIICRRFPPAVQLMYRIVDAAANGGGVVPMPQVVGKAAGFPVIRDDMWCGEFAQKLVEADSSEVLQIGQARSD